MQKLEITDIQRGCTHDGPGLRTTVFLKGCPLNCRWCHNPETKRLRKEIFFHTEKCMHCMHCTAVCPNGAHLTENDMHRFDPSACTGCMQCAGADICPTGAIESVSETKTTDEVLKEILLDRVFYRRGGVTVSGGEPTMQPEGLLELLRAVKAEGISAYLETCGVFPKSLIPALVACTDLFLYDIKDTDAVRLRENTGARLQQVTENLLEIDRLGGATILRCILIPNVNMNDRHAHALAELFKKLSFCQYVELLPYHPYGLSKTEKLGQTGIRYRQPETEELLHFADELLNRQVPVKLHGSMVQL